MKDHVRLSTKKWVQPTLFAWTQSILNFLALGFCGSCCGHVEGENQQNFFAKESTNY